MKKKRIMGICLALLMLIMSACGGHGDVAQGISQENEPGIQEYETEKQENEPETQEYESVIQENEPEIPKNEPETQEQTSETGDFQEDTTNDNLPIYGNYYYDLVNVVLYLEVFDELPPNYITKNEARLLGWEGGPVEKYKEGAAIGGDTFGNREGLLPEADSRNYTECDIDTNGYSSRGSRRLVFSNDGLYFYTADHYETFSEVTVTENYEVIW